MENLHFASRSTTREPSTDQIMRLDKALTLINTRRNHKIETTLALVEDAGFKTFWRRVRWTGGVGSYSLMRGCVIRVLLSATKSGYAGSKTELKSYAQGNLYAHTTATKQRGFRYGWCLEIV